MKKTYKYKIRNQSNTIKLGNMLDDMHQVHIHFMLLQRRYYRRYKKNISYNKMSAHLTKLKDTTKPHWKQLPSQVAQNVVKRIALAYDAFFRNIKERKAGKTTRKVGRPKIKPQHKYNSMTFTQAGYKLEDNRIKINCIDTWYTFHKHREIKGTIKTVTIKRDKCGDYWICFSCEHVDHSDPFPKTGESAGFDFGLKTFLTCSDGSKIESPQFLKQSLNKLKTLNIDGMKRLWGRKLDDLAFYQFIQIVEQKCAKHGKTFKPIDKWTSSTKPCSNCGKHNKTLSLSDRQWTCPSCSVDHDRDINAAINIKRAGLAAQGGGDIRQLSLFGTAAVA